MASAIHAHLWYSEKAEEAAKFYASIFPNSRVDSVTTMPTDTPSGPEGSVKIVEFTLLGERFMAITAGPLDSFNHAISLMVECDTQEEIDKYWNALLADGGQPEPCGWLKDKYGLSWQITPRALFSMMKDKNHDRAKRVADRMLKMQKLDLPELQRAYNA
jgi:predicted 3-demethylubiquinone-9 3-methyltransferase (glyoxalase superfamily)